MTERQTMHVGTWVSADGRLRVRLDVDGRFHEIRSDRAKTYGGIYTIEGARIRFYDPTTGYETVGELRGEVMYADGCEFLKSSDDAPA